MKALILSASFGGGHKSVASTLKRIFESHYFIEAEVVDLYELFNRKINEFFTSAYVWMMRHCPRLYGLFYEVTARGNGYNIFNYLFSFPGKRELMRLLEKDSYSCIVVTYPTYGNVISRLRDEGFPVPPTFVVITDFMAHSQWFHRDVACYFVPSEEMRWYLYRRGLTRTRIKVTGIPIQPEFDLFRAEDRSEIVVSAGVFGMTPSIMEICEVLKSFEGRGINIHLLCGKDEKLYKKMKERFPTFKITPGMLSQSEMAKIFGGALVLISKAGGLTTSEALASETPMIIYKPLPGQEYYNALYLSKNEAGLIAENPEELKNLLELILTDKSVRKRLLENIQRIKKPQAGFEVGKIIREYLG